MRKIFVVIERRADYSRFKPILQLLKKDRFFKLHLVVTGINLLPDHGEDILKIKQDGFKINSTIQMFDRNSPDTGAAMVRGISNVLREITQELTEAKPDIVLTGFDIGANFATTIAAAHMNLPVAHIQGGEITGSIDESLRHAMSKFAHIHFPATLEAKERLIKMGENPKLIFVVGCPSLDALLHAPQIPTAQLEKRFRVDFSQPVALLIQHPVTTENTDSLSQIKHTLQALAQVKTQVIAILPNNDAGFKNIFKTIPDSKLNWFPSIDIDSFANLYRHISTIVGNSSSGIHEAASFGVPTVNVGNRQQGRLKPANVIDTTYQTKQIAVAVQRAIYDSQFRQLASKVVNPYGDGRTAPKIVKVLKRIKLTGIIQKKFYE